MESSGRGLIARFLYASPPARIGTTDFRTAAIQPETEAAYRGMVYRLMAIKRPDEPTALRWPPTQQARQRTSSRSMKPSCWAKDRPSPTGQASTSERCCVCQKVGTLTLPDLVAQQTNALFPFTPKQRDRNRAFAYFVLKVRVESAQSSSGPPRLPMMG